MYHNYYNQQPSVTNRVNILIVNEGTLHILHEIRQIKDRATEHQTYLQLQCGWQENWNTNYYRLY